MKKWIGTILLVLGLVAAACGGYGLYKAAANTQVAQWGGFDAVASMMRTATGLSFSQKLMLFTLQNRAVLAFGGLIAAVAGFFVRRLEK